MVGFKASVQRTGFQVSLARVGGRSCESRKRVQEHKREFCDWRVVLNSPTWTSPTGSWSNQCPYGAEPRPWDIPLLHFHVTKNKRLPMY